MRILILGGDGMLGHQLFQALGSRHEVRVTLRQTLAHYSALNLFHDASAYDEVDVRNLERVRHVMVDFRPDAVVNATDPRDPSDLQSAHAGQSTRLGAHQSACGRVRRAQDSTLRVCREFDRRKDAGTDR